MAVDVEVAYRTAINYLARLQVRDSAAPSGGGDAPWILLVKMHLKDAVAGSSEADASIGRTYDVDAARRAFAVIAQQIKGNDWASVLVAAQMIGSVASAVYLESDVSSGEHKQAWGTLAANAVVVSEYALKRAAAEKTVDKRKAPAWEAEQLALQHRLDENIRWIELGLDPID